MTRVMVVDDELGTLSLLRIMLQRGGFRVSTAQDGLMALEMLKQSTPDLFILDISMPGMDGLELLKQIRARPETSTTPAIVLTARSDPEAVAEASDAGVSSYLVKPILYDDVMAEARRVLSDEDGEQAAADEAPLNNRK